MMEVRCETCAVPVVRSLSSPTGGLLEWADYWYHRGACRLGNRVGAVTYYRLGRLVCDRLERRFLGPVSVQ